MIIYRDVHVFMCVCVLLYKTILIVSGIGQGTEYSQIYEAENTKPIIHMKKLRLSLSNLLEINKQ